jgi:hypothetical protein
MPAAAFTSTSSALIANTFTSRNSVIIANEGAGILAVIIGSNSAVDETASATNYTVRIPSGSYWESPPGVVGKYFGIFLTAGTARVTEAANRLN